MTSRVRPRLIVAPVLILSTAVLLIAADRSPNDPADLTVHEWGTFTSVAGKDGAAIDWDALGCTDDLPAFVHDFGYRGFKWRLRGTVRMETPVIYFYSPRAVEMNVTVAFPSGLITEWYPQADYAVYQTSDRNGAPRRLAPTLNGIDTSLRSVTGALEWRHIKVQPNTAPALPVESDSSHYYAARETDAAPLSVGAEREKFLFYRGVGRFPIPLSVRLSADGKIVVDNRGQDTVPSVILFENRGGKIGYRNVGAVEDMVTLDPPPLDDGQPQLRDDLENALVEQGLFPREAQAMVETWQDSWFEDGARLIYIVPQRAVDAILPLRIQPAPSQIARVFVGRIELVTQQTRRAVAEALTTGDWSTIDRYGRFLDPILKRMEIASPEMARQIDQFRGNMNRGSGGGRCW